MVASEAKLMSCSAVIHQPPNRSSYSMSTRLLQEVSTHLARAALQSVSPCTSRKTPRPKSSYSNLALWCYPTAVFAVSMSLTRWTIIRASSSTKPWSNRLSLWQKLASFARSTLAQPSSQPLIQLSRSTTPSFPWWRTFSCHQRFCQDLT